MLVWYNLYCFAAIVFQLKVLVFFKKHINIVDNSICAFVDFRILNPIKPDRRAILEIQLLAQGFTQADQMAGKLCIFLDLAGSLLSTVLCSGDNQ